MFRFGQLLVVAFVAALALAPAVQAAPPEIEQAVDDMLSQSIWEAVTEGDPAKKDALRKRLLDAYDRGGENAFLAEVRKVGEEYGQSAVFAKVPGARDNDIIRFFEVSVAVSRKLEFEDPVLCYKWSFGPQYNESYDPRILVQTVGWDLDRQMSEAIVSLIRNASATPVVYDRAGARQSIQSAAVAVFSNMDQGPLQVIAGARPASSLDEMKATCKASADFYDFLLGTYNAADALRELFNAQPTQVSHLGVAGRESIRMVFEAGDPNNAFAGMDINLRNSFR